MTEIIFTQNYDNYEKILIKYEEDIRRFIKTQYEMKQYIDHLENKLEEQEDIMRDNKILIKKLEKYETIIQSKDYEKINVKENEILILRAENTNVKKKLTEYEDKIKMFDLQEKKMQILKLNHEKEIVELKNEKHSLLQKIANLENIFKNKTKENENSPRVIKARNHSLHMNDKGLLSTLNKEDSRTESIAQNADIPNDINMVSRSKLEEFKANKLIKLNFRRNFKSVNKSSGNVSADKKDKETPLILNNNNFNFVIRLASMKPKKELQAMNKNPNNSKIKLDLSKQNSRNEIGFNQLDFTKTNNNNVKFNRIVNNSTINLKSFSSSYLC